MARLSRGEAGPGRGGAALEPGCAGAGRGRVEEPRGRERLDGRAREAVDLEVGWLVRESACACASARRRWCH
jgi:hypothetical protein